MWKVLQDIKWSYSIINEQLKESNCEKINHQSLLSQCLFFFFFRCWKSALFWKSRTHSENDVCLVSRWWGGGWGGLNGGCLFMRPEPRAHIVIFDWSVVLINEWMKRSEAGGLAPVPGGRRPGAGASRCHGDGYRGMSSETGLNLGPGEIQAF